MTTDTPTPPPSYWNLPSPPPPSAPPTPAFTPSLIAALLASVAIAIGSAGTWTSVLILNVNGTVGPGGKFTLALGLAAAVVLVVVGFGKMQAGGLGLAMTAGILAFGQGLYSAVRLLSVEDIDFFGAKIGAEVGWGLWLVLIASVALIVAAAVAYKQSEK